MANKRSQEPKGTRITITRVYHPNLQRQLQALQFLLDTPRQRTLHTQSGQAVAERLGEDNQDMKREGSVTRLQGEVVLHSKRS